MRRAEETPGQLVKHPKCIPGTGQGRAGLVSSDGVERCLLRVRTQDSCGQLCSPGLLGGPV